VLFACDHRFLRVTALAAASIAATLRPGCRAHDHIVLDQVPKKDKQWLHRSLRLSACLEIDLNETDGERPTAILATGQNARYC
jgi:hypothetical protein